MKPKTTVRHVRIESNEVADIRAKDCQKPNHNTYASKTVDLGEKLGLLHVVFGRGGPSRTAI
ncbi:hypothetical protein KBY28_21560, partial [Ruegeria pomeroyi]|uniref:hypothetical protein n=1 Tax=Ruegeria pomeroyi TaxID=89184 RepID=UPI001F18ED8E